MAQRETPRDVVYNNYAAKCVCVCAGRRPKAQSAIKSRGLRISRSTRVTRDY